MPPNCVHTNLSCTLATNLVIDLFATGLADIQSNSVIGAANLDAATG